MENSLKKFLEFNGENVYFKAIDGKWWIAIKPICQALHVDYIQQFKNVKKDEILSGVLCNHTIHDASFRLQNMACLPEDFIYGWLFQIQSGSPELKEYKWKCYKVLHDYFHGTITERTSSLKEKTELDMEIEKVEEELKSNPLSLRLQELKEKKRGINKSLRELDNNIITSQLELWDLKESGTTA